jgi:hypothetical protein
MTIDCRIAKPFADRVACWAVTPELLAQLKDARRRAGSVTALAEILHLSRQRTADLLGGKSKYPLNVRGCLRLALSEGRDPLDVLRKAGHADEAELLQQLFASADNRPRLSRFGAWLLAAAGRPYSERDQKIIRSVIERLTTPEPAAPARKTPRKKRRP